MLEKLKQSLPARVQIKVTPKAARSCIDMVEQDESGQWFAKAKLHAPPADGQANDELIRLIANVFNLPKTRIAIIRGETSRIKVVQIG